MSLTAWLLFFYVFGGFTLIPLLILAVVVYFYWALPLVPPNDDPAVLYNNAAHDQKPPPQQPNPQPPNSIASSSNPIPPKSYSHAKNPSLSLDKEHETGVDAYFSGVLIVAHEYFIYPTGGPSNSAEASAIDTQKQPPKKTDSAYSSLYKLLNNSLPKSSSTTSNTQFANSTVEPSDSTAAKNTKKTKLSKYHAVLRHGNLFLYEDPDHDILKHVIVIAHYLVTLWPPNAPDGELFAKRSAICLLKIPHTTNNVPQALNDCEIAEMLSDPTKPPQNSFFLYSDLASEKEDFYFALIRASKNHKLLQENDDKQASLFNPVYMAHPLHHKTSDIMYLINTLHSTDANIQTRWLNAFIGRIFLSVKDTPQFTNFLHNKIANKLTRIKRPTYLGEIRVTKLSCGNALPYFTSPRLTELTPEGKLTVQSDVSYDGKFSVQITTKVKLNLGQRFKAREVTIALAITLEHLEGKMLFRIKPPPSDRIWYTFESTPKMSLRIEPVVSTRQIKISMVTNAIENKIRESIKESLVFPNFEDIAFFNTRDEIYRGGIWDSTVRPNAFDTNAESRDFPEQEDSDTEVPSAEVISSIDQSDESQSSTLRHRKTAPNLRHEPSAESLLTLPTTYQHILSKSKTRSMDSLVAMGTNESSTSLESPVDPKSSPSTRKPVDNDFVFPEPGHASTYPPTASSFNEDGLKSHTATGTIIDTVKKWSGWYSKDRHNSNASLDSRESLPSEFVDNEFDSPDKRRNSQESIRSRVKLAASEYRQTMKPSRVKQMSFYKDLQKSKTDIEDKASSLYQEYKGSSHPANSLSMSQPTGVAAPNLSARRLSVSSVKGSSVTAPASSAPAPKPKQAPQPHTFPPELMEILNKEEEKIQRKKTLKNKEKMTDPGQDDQKGTDTKQEAATQVPNVPRVPSTNKKKQVARKPVKSGSETLSSQPLVDTGLDKLKPAAELHSKQSLGGFGNVPAATLDPAFGGPNTHKSKPSESSIHTISQPSGIHTSLSSSTGMDPHTSYGTTSLSNNLKGTRRSSMHSETTSPVLKPVPRSPNSQRSSRSFSEDESYSNPKPSNAHHEMDGPGSPKAHVSSPKSHKKPFIKPDETPDIEGLSPSLGSPPVTSDAPPLARGFSVRRKAVRSGDIAPKVPSILHDEGPKENETLNVPKPLVSEGSNGSATTVGTLTGRQDDGEDASPYTSSFSVSDGLDPERSKQDPAVLAQKSTPKAKASKHASSSQDSLSGQSKGGKLGSSHHFRSLSKSLTGKEFSKTPGRGDDGSPSFVKKESFSDTTGSHSFFESIASFGSSFGSSVKKHANSSVLRSKSSYGNDLKDSFKQAVTRATSKKPSPVSADHSKTDSVDAGFSFPADNETSQASKVISVQPQATPTTDMQPLNDGPQPDAVNMPSYIPHIAAPPQLATRSLTKRVSSDYLRGRTNNGTSQGTHLDFVTSPSAPQPATTTTTTPALPNTGYERFGGSGGDETGTRAPFNEYANAGHPGLHSSVSMGSITSVGSSKSVGSLGAVNVTRPAPATTKFMHDFTLDEFGESGGNSSGSSSNLHEKLESGNGSGPYGHGMKEKAFSGSLNLMGSAGHLPLSSSSSSLSSGLNVDSMFPVTLPQQQPAVLHHKLSAQSIKHQIGQSFSTTINSWNSIKRVSNDGDDFDDEYEEGTREEDEYGTNRGRTPGSGSSVPTDFDFRRTTLVGPTSLLDGETSNEEYQDTGATQQVPQVPSTEPVQNVKPHEYKRLVDGDDGRAVYNGRGGGGARPGGVAITTPPAPVIMSPYGFEPEPSLKRG